MSSHHLHLYHRSMPVPQLLSYNEHVYVKFLITWCMILSTLNWSLSYKNTINANKSERLGNVVVNQNQWPADVVVSFKWWGVRAVAFPHMSPTLRPLSLSLAPRSSLLLSRSPPASYVALTPLRLSLLSSSLFLSPSLSNSRGLPFVSGCHLVVGSHCM